MKSKTKCSKCGAKKLKKTKVVEMPAWMQRQFELVESTLETWPEAKQAWAKERGNDE
jgi:hypothetical protein